MYLKFADIRVVARDVVCDDDHTALVFARLLAAPEAARGIAYFVRQKGGDVDSLPYLGRLCAPAGMHVVAARHDVQGIPLRLLTLYAPRQGERDYYLVVQDGDLVTAFRRCVHAHTPYPVPPLREGLILQYATALPVHAPSGRVGAWRLSENAIRQILREATR